MMPESLLAAQREAIAEAIRAAIRERYATSDWDRTEWEAAADAVLVLVDAWLVDAVQAERERLLADVQRRVDHAQGGFDEYPKSEFWRGLRDGLAQLRNDLRDEPVLAVVSRDTRSSA